MKSLLRRLPRSKSKSRRSENPTTSGGGGGGEAQNSKLDDLWVPKIDPADLKVGGDLRPETGEQLISSYQFPNFRQLQAFSYKNIAKFVLFATS